MSFLYIVYPMILLQAVVSFGQNNSTIANSNDNKLHKNKREMDNLIKLYWWHLRSATNPSNAWVEQ